MRTLDIAGISVPPGQRRLGKIPCGELPDGTVIHQPLIVVNGASEGPLLWLGAGLHGTEIPGMEVIRRVTREAVDPGHLRGGIVAAPLLNPFSFHQHQMLTPQDGYNLNRVFPGDEAMLLSHRLAAQIARLADPCDACIDFHANPTPALQFSIVKHTGDEAVWERSPESQTIHSSFSICSVM